jgi:hypothetical protein
MKQGETQVVSGAAAEMLGHVRALILLGGSMRSTPLTDAIDRSILDLPIEKNLSALERWCDQTEALAKRLNQPSLDVRVVVDGLSPLPADPGRRSGVSVSIERDPFEYRGTAGVLADISADYGREDILVVANATQLPLWHLSDQVELMAESEAEVSILTASDGTPTGTMLLPCAALEGVARIGYVDLKEQALPGIAEKHRVRVIRRNEPTGPSIRTLAGYLSTVRAHHLREEWGGDGQAPWRESWAPIFQIVEEGATVEEGARVYDSVVLAGGRVSAGATAVGSLIGPLGHVRRGRRVTGVAIGGRGARDRRRRERETG